jgi:membrane-bound serine protease (ClpP class)
MGTLGWPLVFLALALVLLVSEVFIPSCGTMGVAATFCLVYSLWLAFRQSTALGLKFLAADVVLLPLVFSLAMYLWPRSPLAKYVLLRPPAPEEIEVSRSPHRLDHLVGQFGRALTTLRPSGLVDFDGRRLDGLSEDGLIARGALVQAVRVRSGQLVVRVAPGMTSDETPDVN